jgi:hypothetical protein
MPASTIKNTGCQFLIIRIALLLMFALFAVFISVALLLWLAVHELPELMSWIGLTTLLSACALLLISGLVIIIKLTIDFYFDYFYARQRLQRRLLFSK